MNLIQICGVETVPCSHAMKDRDVPSVHKGKFGMQFFFWVKHFCEKLWKHYSLFIELFFSISNISLIFIIASAYIGQLICMFISFDSFVSCFPKEFLKLFRFSVYIMNLSLSNPELHWKIGTNSIEQLCDLQLYLKIPPLPLKGKCQIRQHLSQCP